MHNLLSDVRHAGRLLAKTPGFTLVAVATLALGIGANTAIFSVVHAVLLAPLPYQDGDRLVRAVRSQPSMLATIAGYPDYTDWRTSGVFASAGVLSGRGAFLETDEGPQMLRGAGISDDFLPTLGVQPVVGRNFYPDEIKTGANVIIISHGLWTRQTGGDAQVTSRDLKISRQLYRVVGVLPANYRDPISPVAGRDVYFPMQVPAKDATDRNSYWLHLIGRLKPGVSLPQAKGLVESLSERGLQQGGNTMQLPKFTAVPLRQQQVGEARGALWLLLGAVGFVLLIACANVSNLLLARANARGHEMAIRAAVGASRARLLQQLITENLLLSALGGVVALVLMLWGLEAVKSITPVEIPRLDQAALNLPVFGFAVLATMLCGVLFGAVPALRASRQDVMGVLRNAGSAGGMGQRRAFATLLVSEVVLTTVLLAGASLALQSFFRLLRVDTGFETREALTVTTVYAGEWQAAQQAAFFDQLCARARALPGVTSVGVVDNLPLSGSWSQYNTNLQSFLQRVSPNRALQKIQYEASAVSPDYFRSMGIPLRSGRLLSAPQSDKAPLEVVVSESFARNVWGKENPIGQRVNIGGREKEWAEVVGVVGDVRHRGLDAHPTSTMYVPFGKRGMWGGTLVVQSSTNLEALTAAIRGLVQQLDRNVMIQRVRSVKDLFGEQTASARFLALLLGSFAGVATLLAMVGTYGVSAYAVSQRVQEMGIRLALGAQPRSVLRMVVGEGMTLVAAGVALGAGAAIWLTRYLRTLLFEVDASRPVTYVAVAASLLAAALLACYLPARRAARIDPMVALRHE